MQLCVQLTLQVPRVTGTKKKHYADANGG